MKKGEITTWGCLQCSKGSKTPGEASWSMLPACIEWFKTWCFSFQKQWTHWHYNPLFFWVEWHIPVFVGHFSSAEMAFGYGYYDKQRRIGMWRASINMQPYSIEKNIYKNELDTSLPSIACSEVHGTENKHIYKHFIGHYKNRLHFTL